MRSHRALPTTARPRTLIPLLLAAGLLGTGLPNALATDAPVAGASVAGASVAAEPLAGEPLAALPATHVPAVARPAGAPDEETAGRTEAPPWDADDPPDGATAPAARALRESDSRVPEAVPWATERGTAPRTAQGSARTETMTHWSCDRTARAVVSVTWLAKDEARIRWSLTDARSDGRSAVMKIVGIDHNGSRPALRRAFFGGDGMVVNPHGAGTVRTGGRTWRPGLRRLHEVEVWIWNGFGRERVSCGYNVVKRLNDHLYPPERTTPASYTRSKALRKRVVAEAWRQYRGVNHERRDNCSRYSHPFYSPNICHAWCSDFAWWVWTTAGVPRAKQYNSSYTDDFEDEWRVRFKPLGGPRKPAPGDVVVWSHRTDGINGHVGVVVATRGWMIQYIHGNWSDRVWFTGWTNPFTATSDAGRKHVIGFASPA